MNRNDGAVGDARKRAEETQHSVEKDAPVRLVAMAVHEDICGCERGYRVHGRTYVETAHVVLNALGENGWRVIPLPDTFTIGTSAHVTSPGASA